MIILKQINYQKKEKKNIKKEIEENRRIDELNVKNNNTII